ncbi:MAG: lysylphosphatidylglycerol synthase transmembrane domain-containing protein [Bacteroidota bacterium]
MAPRTKILLRTALSFLLAGVFLYIAFRGTNFNDLLASLRDLRYWWIALLIPVGLSSHYVRALRWKYMLGHVKETWSVRNLFAAVMIGYMVNNALPRVGELVRPYVAGRLEGISKSTALGSVVVERIIDTVALVAIVCLILFVSPATLSAFVEDAENLRPFFLAGSVVSLVLLTLLFLKSESVVRSAKGLVVLVPARSRDRVHRLFDSFASGFRVSTMKEEFWRIGALSVIMWGLYALGLYLPFLAYPSLDAAGLDMAAAVVLLAVSSVAFVLPAPGAFGTYHSFMKYALMRLYGVDEVTALSYTIVTHELNVLTTTVVGAWFFLKDHLRVSDVAAEAERQANSDGGESA